MENTQEISLLDLWNLFLKHAGKIIGLTILGAVLSVAFMFAFVTPQYSSRAQLIVVQKQQQEANINLSEIQTNLQLINTYRDILTADSVLAAVNERMGNQYSLNELRDSINVSQSQNSQAFNVSVTLDQPDEAQNVLNNLITAFEETVSNVYGQENANITVLSPASYNPNKVSPNPILYGIIGAFIGGALSLLLVLTQEVSDTTIKSDEFLQGLGLINLGSVTEITGKDLKQSRLGGKKQTRSRERV